MPFLAPDTPKPQNVQKVPSNRDSELAIMRKLRQLSKQAKAAGGDVIVMNGNHEIMNVIGDFRYATPWAFEECRRYAEKKRAKAGGRVR